MGESVICDHGMVVGARQAGVSISVTVRLLGFSHPRSVKFVWVEMMKAVREILPIWIVQADRTALK